jgi:hypothetical protein
MEEVVKRHTLESFREKLQLVLVQGTSVRGFSWFWYRVTAIKLSANPPKRRPFWRIFGSANS